MRHILIVEDDSITALHVKNILKEIGAVEIAKNGVKALEKMRQKAYELIITNDNMPLMSGEELYKRLFILNKGLAKKIMFLSANITDFMRSTGCIYLEKPFNKEELIEAAKKLIH
jgi:DNA-binding response OmpR family regulator